jgi:terminase large subunit-like protein
MTESELKFSAFQQRALEVPETFDLFAGGGRGGGKSTLLCLLALRHVAQHGEHARVLFVRQTFKALADFALLCREVFGTVFGPDARFNQAEGVWRFPGGSYMELGQLESHADYSKYQGRSFSLLLADEVSQYPTPDLLDLLRSNLRAPRDIPIRVAMAGNPGGPGHFWVARRYVFRAQPWQPFYEEKSKREFVYAPSTLRDNCFIDQQEYAAQLASACASDGELLRAWELGDWAVARGAYFAGVLEESRVAVGPFTEAPAGWRTWLAHDFGSSAPSVTLLMAESPGQELAGRYYPRGSIVVLDELAAYRRDNLNMGLGWTAATTAEAIRSELCDRWRVSPVGCADDSIFARTGSSAGSIADEFARCGVRFEPARKGDRLSGWERMKRMLADAGKPDVPGLYISRSCAYWWATVPYLARDQRRVEDVDSSGPDHAADACRYGLLYEHLAMGRLDIPFAM